MTSLSALVKGFSDPVIVVAADMKVHLYNRAALELFGKLESETLLFRITRVADLLDAVKNAFDKKTKTSLGFTLEKRYKRTIEATLVPLNNGDEPTLLFVHMRDMSEPERLAKMRMHFIANASHELRTPLASLSGFIETLQTTAHDDEEARDRFLQIMAQQTRRMSRLIDDLLSLSQLEMNTDTPPEIPVDITATLSGVVNLLTPFAKENNVVLKTDFPEGPCCVFGENDELIQVFQNIIQNAIRYGGEGGAVWISISRIGASKNHPPRLAISVRDKGPGIAAKHIPRLTERFYRVDKVISRNKGGTGLGLAIAKHIIVRHRGKLEIRSKPGKGATFTVLLPEARQNCKKSSEDPIV